MPMDREEKLVAYIKKYVDKHGYGPRSEDLISHFVPDVWSSRSSLFTHLGKLVDRRTLEKKAEPRIDRYPRYYVSEEEGDKAVYRESFKENRLIPRMKIHVDIPKPVAGTVGFLVSEKEQSVKTIMIDPGETLASDLIQALNREGSRRELGDVLLSVTKLYSEFLSKEIGISADYYKVPRNVVFIGRLPSDISETMKEAIDNGFFENYYELIRGLVKFAVIQVWDETWKSFQNPQFREGREGVAYPVGYRYNPTEKKIEPIPKETIMAKLRSQLLDEENARKR